MGFWGEDEKPRLPKRLLDTQTSCVFQAARYGNPQYLSSLLLSSPHLVDAQDEDDDNPLHKAVANNHRECVKILLSYGANVNSIGCSSRTPLHVACHEGNSELAKLLLGHGAIVDLYDSLEETALHKAASVGSVQLIFLLFTSGQFVDINASNVLECTPLSNAAHRGNFEAADLLLSLGADASICDVFGYSPFQIAQCKKFFAVGELIRNHKPTQPNDLKNHDTFNSLFSQLNRL